MHWFVLLTSVHLKKKIKTKKNLKKFKKIIIIIIIIFY